MKTKMLLTSLALTGTLIFSGFALAQQGQQYGQQGQQGQQEMSGQQQGMGWQQENTQGKGANLTISPSTVKQIQMRLSQAGFDPGQADGNWGQQSSRALAEYQRRNGLEPTGEINFHTLQSLGIPLTGQYGIAPQFGQGPGMQRGQMGGQYQQQPYQQGFQQPQFQGGSQGYQGNQGNR